MATSLNKNDVVKTAKRWCQGSKNSKYKKKSGFILVLNKFHKILRYVSGSRGPLQRK